MGRLAFAAGWGLWLALGVTLAVRVLVFLLLMSHPVVNEFGEGVSPLNKPTKGDLPYYERTRDRLAQLDLAGLIAGQKENAVHALADGGDFNWKVYFTGPVFPLMLLASDYRDGNTLPLATAFLVMGVVWVWMWQIWMYRRGVGWGWLMLLALLPTPVWYIVTISSDLPFALLFTLFVFVFLSRAQSGVFDRPWLWTPLLLMLPLTRPNGMSMLLFVGVALLWAHYTQPHSVDAAPTPRWRRYAPLALIGVAGVALGFYFFPYLLGYIHVSQKDPFFGIEERDYWAGLFHTLPIWLDQPLSWIALMGAKLLSFMGMRYSYYSTHGSMLVLALRWGSGALFLIGFIRLMWRGQSMQRLLVLCYMAPFFLGAAQERYLLPIMPLLMFHCAWAINTLGRRWGWRHPATWKGFWSSGSAPVTTPSVSYSRRRRE
ncbi:hypothetical protein MAIT1_01851 [Magnetofaba australis IT-1]|uniref:Glycosyltransferase RgtA/B/C/D-like domain-containing protein n=1 Tax=Magnetofaba australis IT-1 TaxID=1434232 RepID=A0A1Y2K1F9_9PROT|nr:hypothetical protein MAIT1_01851 [Magnetofaba australis IT-1]